MKTTRILGLGAAGIVVLATLATGAIYVVSEQHLHRRYDIAPEQIAVPADAQAAARGRHAASIHGCTGCHGADLSGARVIDDPLFGTYYAANLTAGAGGSGAGLTPAGWERAVRHGVAPDGHPLLVMPSTDLHALGAADLGDIIAFARSLPPVDHLQPPSRPGPLARALLLFTDLPLLTAELIDQRAPHPAAPAPGVTAEYGAYLTRVCTGCHQPDFAGGPVPGEHGMVAANLTMDAATGLGAWSEADFLRTARTGTRPDGRQLAPAMPLVLTSNMTDDELSAVWRFLQSLPVLPARTE